MKFSDRFKTINNTGYATSSADNTGRIVNKDGGSNVIKRGVSIFERISLFHWLINMSISKFLSLALIFFIIVNLFFAALYYFIGIEHLGGIEEGRTSFENFCDCFFFSTQTITTVGYGVLHPTSFLTNSLSSLETLFGWMAFAVLTGLLYGRFAKPKAYLRFSNHALLSPYNDGKAIMFRVAPFKNNTLTEAEVLLNVAFKIHENGKVANKFLSLKTEINKITSLALSWTVVHHINEESPFYGMCEEDFKINDTEIMVFIKAFDEHFSNVVQQRTSYVADEIIFNAKFKPMFKQHESKKTTVLELNKINDYQLV